MPASLQSIWKRRPAIWLGAGVILLTGAGLGAARMRRPSHTDIPTAQVVRGDLVDAVQLRGDLKALVSASVIAPSNAGDIQIMKLLKPGTLVKKGDVVCELDRATLQTTLDQRKSDLKQADAQIENSRAQARLTEQTDQTALLTAQYDVERAKLEASKQEILSKIDGEEKKLALADAEQKLKETQQKLESDRASAAADLASNKQKREKALFDVRIAEAGLARMVLVAPTDGIVNPLMNFRAGGPNQMPPPFKEGDRAWAGAAIAEIPDLDTLRISVKVDESDRGKLAVAQKGTAKVDALPEKELSGTVEDISPLAKPDFNSSWPPPKNFDLTFKFDNIDSRLRPGLSATTRIAVDRLPDAIIVPADAIFTKSGVAVAYVQRNSGFEERAVTVVKRNSSGQVAISKGLVPGERVALKDPTVEAAK